VLAHPQPAAGRNCQDVRTLAGDREIERIVLEALMPDKLALALATMNEVEREDAALQKQWQLRLERARYEVELARRQYDARIQQGQPGAAREDTPLPPGYGEAPPWLRKW